MMQIFPIPPTDNIFKFSAIFGLIGSSISFLLFIYFSYLLAHLEVAGKLLMPSYRAQETLDKVNCRAAAIANGRFEICKFEEFKYLNIVDGSQREIEYLEHIKKSQGEIVAEYENHAKISSPISDNIRWIIDDRIVLVLVFIPAAFFGLFLFGFKNWSRMQKNENDLSKLNYQIRFSEKKKLENEILTQKRSFNKRS